MRRFDKQITEYKIIEDILKNAEICRLGFVDNNEAYIVPVNYAYENSVIYIHSANSGRKINLIQQNNKISFEIEADHEIIRGEKACNWTTRYRSVMGRGIAVINNDNPTKKYALDLIMRKYGAESELLIYDDKILDRMTIIKIKIESITGKQSGIW